MASKFILHVDSNFNISSINTNRLHLPRSDRFQYSPQQLLDTLLLHNSKMAATKEVKDVGIKYLDVIPELPASTPLGCPHIIDLASLNSGTIPKDLRMADVVVTILYNHSLETLRLFLNPSEQNFQFCRVSEGNEQDFVIQKLANGRKVRVRSTNHAFTEIYANVIYMKVGYYRRQRTELGKLSRSWQKELHYKIDFGLEGRWSQKLDVELGVEMLRRRVWAETATEDVKIKRCMDVPDYLMGKAAVFERERKQKKREEREEQEMEKAAGPSVPVDQGN